MGNLKKSHCMKTGIWKDKKEEREKGNKNKNKKKKKKKKKKKRKRNGYMPVQVQTADFGLEIPAYSTMVISGFFVWKI